MRSHLVSAARAVTLPLGLTALIALLVVAYAWPTSHVGPRELPVAVVGSPAFVQATTGALDRAGAKAFDVRVAPTRAGGEAMLRSNEVDGLFVESGSYPDLELASAGRPAVAQLLTQVDTAMLAGAVPARVSDTVAGPNGDPRASVFVAAALPSMIGAIAAGIILALVGGTRRARLLRLAAVAVGSGLALVLVMNTWLDALPGAWWALAGAYVLGVGAVICAIGGVHHHFGRVGMMAVGASLMILGNPLSGATSAPELLPRGWSALGQALPPGALASALRAVGFYGGNGAAAPILVLAAWVAVGLLLHLAASVRSHRRHA